MEGSIAERVASLINGLWDLGHAVGDFFFGGGDISVAAVRAAIGSALTAAHF
jgi:hypothetical protein